MLSDEPRRKLSEEFHRLKEICQGEDVLVVELIQALRSRGHALITLFFAFPFLLPIPVPGLSILFGLFIALAGIGICFGQKPWLPRRWLKKPLPSRLLIPLFQAGEKILSRVERVVRPRGKFFMTHPWTQFVTGTMIAIAGLFLALPLPPGTNFPPALAILLLSIGTLEEDGLFLALGYLAFLLNVFLFGLIITLGFEGARALLGL